MKCVIKGLHRNKVYIVLLCKVSSPFQIQRRIAAFIEKKQNEVDENNRQEFCSVFQSMEGQFT